MQQSQPTHPEGPSRKEPHQGRISQEGALLISALRNGKKDGMGVRVVGLRLKTLSCCPVTLFQTVAQRHLSTSKTHSNGKNIGRIQTKVLTTLPLFFP